MDLTYSDEQRLLVESASRFLEARCTPAVVRESEHTDRGFLDDLWRDTAAQGWPGIALPVEFGGGGGGITDLAVLAEELGRFALPSPLLTSFALGALPILWHGDATQHSRWMSGLTSGAIVATLALVEPGARDEWSDIALRGTRVANGWQLHGTKILVPYAPNADVMLIAAVLDDVGVAIVVLEPKATRTRYTRHDSISREALFAVDFDGVEVSEGALLVGPTETHSALDRALDHAAVLGLAYNIGVARRALDLSVEYARNREQFGRPIGSFQAVAHRCVDMRLDLDACRMLALHASWVLDTVGHAETEVSAAKSYANGALRRIMAHAHQVHGAIGYSEECDLQLFSRRAKAFELTYGGTSLHRERVAKGIGL